MWVMIPDKMSGMHPPDKKNSILHTAWNCAQCTPVFKVIWLSTPDKAAPMTAAYQPSKFEDHANQRWLGYRGAALRTAKRKRY